jgi:hypothetical protein
MLLVDQGELRNQALAPKRIQRPNALSQLGPIVEELDIGHVAQLPIRR